MSESERIFDRETLLDLTVNVIPLGIILFFVVVYLLVTPWEFDPFVTAISMGLLAVPFVALAFLTYLSGRAVSEAEKSAADATAIDDSFEESGALESGETEASADTTEGVTDDEAAARSDESDTGADAEDGAEEDDVGEDTADADAETTDTDTTEDESESESADGSDGNESDEEN